MSSNYYNLPQSTYDSLIAYIDGKIPPGHFLTGVLENCLVEAIARADSKNLAALPNIVMWLYNEAPAECWGSRAKVSEWLGGKVKYCKKCGAAERNG